MVYRSNKFSTLGYANGFPFLLTERPGWLTTSGIFPSGNVDNVVNNYWNLAKITTEFRVNTDHRPLPYVSGWAHDPDLEPVKGSGRYVRAEYEVINSADEEEYPPLHRQCKEVTGRNEDQSIELISNLIDGSGSGYASCFVTKGGDSPFEHSDYDFTIPITLQPTNTGAFVITSEASVANHFENLPEFGAGSEFTLDMYLDMGSGVAPLITDQRKACEQTWYIVPAVGWRFSVESGRLDAEYYRYPESQYEYPEGEVPSSSLRKGYLHGMGDTNLWKNAEGPPDS